MKRFLVLMLSVLGFFGLFSVPSMAQDDDTGANNVIDEDGYYYVYAVSGTTERGMTVQNGRFCWDPLERANPAFVFKIVKAAADNTYYLYNLKEDSWYYEITKGYFAEFKQGEENRAAVLFDPQDDDKTSFKVRPVKMRGDYTSAEQYATYGNFQCDGTRSLPGVHSIYHPLAQWGGAIWMVEKVSEAELNAAKMLVNLRKATQVYNDNTLYTLNNSPLITDVPADSDPASGQPGQFFTTCQQTTDSNSSFANLIDGSIDDNKRFQSTWSTVPKPQFIQVDLSADDADGKQVGGVQLQIGLRPNGWGSAEFPTDITVYATNDESIAEDMDLTTIEDVADQANWKWIGDYDLSTKQVLTTGSGGWGVATASALVVDNAACQNRWETKDIVFPDAQKYRFIRFYVNNTAVNASDNHDFTFCEFQLRELENPTTTGAQTEAMQTLRTLIADGQAKVKAQTVSDADLTAIEAAMKAVNDSKSQALARLQEIVDSVTNLNITFTTGTAPGYNDSTAVANYEAALAAAANGTHASHSDAEYEQLGNDLLSALETAKTTVNPVTDGYYNIVNCYTSFFTTMAMAGLPTQRILGWQMYDVNDPAQLFKVTQLGGGQYSIQNVQTGKYIGTIPGQSQEVKVTDAQETPQTITAITGYAGQFNIANTENALAYHTEYHQSGANAKGYICTWNAGGNSGSAWRLVQVTGAKLDSLLAVAPVANRRAIAAHEIDSARAAYDKTFAYKQSAYLITNCDDTDPDNCQWWSLCQEPSANYSSFAHLIDGDLSTVFQSTWQASAHEKPQWLQADLQDNPVKDFSLYYGLRNGTWGAWEQWTQITVFATNDESVAKDENIDTYEQISSSDGWKNFGSFDLPDENAIRNYSGSGRSFVYDINNIFDQKYRFIRFYATHCYKPGPSASTDLGEFTIGELNIMENTYDEASAPYYYIEGLKTAADNLKAQENVVRAAIADGSITQEQIDQLIALRKAVAALTPDKAPLQAVYTADTTYVNNFAAGEEYGDVTEAEWTAVQTALSNAKAVLDADQPSAAELNAQIEALNAAMPTFRAAQKQFEPNKWYYISSRCTTRNGSIEKNGEGETAGIAHVNSIYSTFCYGNVAYASSDNTRAAQGGWGTNNVNALHWGYYAAGPEKGGAGGSDLYADNLDPHTMWRLIPIEGKDGQYAIQNRATGHFMAGYTGSSWIGLTTDTVPYVFDNLGSGVYKFRAAASSVYMQFAGDGYLYSYNAELTDPKGQHSFTLVPVETADNVVMEYPYNNSIFIKSLPYAIDATTIGLNEGYIDFYGVKGLEVVGNDSTLLLEKKTSIQAGEPFIGIAGDYEAFDAENTTTATLLLPAVDAFSFEAKTVNGLTAVLDYTNLNKPGLGYFVNSVLTATQASTGFNGHTGYFDVKNMPLFTTTTDAGHRIPLNGTGVDAIKSITTGKDGVVNVYSIDGKLIKKNVTGSKAGKGLSKGIYIIGKKKVTVK